MLNCLILKNQYSLPAKIEKPRKRIKVVADGGEKSAEKNGVWRWGEEWCVEDKRRNGWRGENGLWENREKRKKRENECGAVGEKNDLWGG
ncbi:hypothetical protein DEO72_LG9g1565 [Vigna unguiculata]|uniref:Uncharacterized protein n=1 Tax=Vigna unguiculata TaxID=3917 RepID=A0A4D6N119_VIGUN|nr:hypothetical protein DEO72_LG9g1565 [Vigna unguiculata]